MYSGIAKCEKKEPPCPIYPFLFPRFWRRGLQLTSALRQDSKLYRYGNIAEIVFIRCHLCFYFKISVISPSSNSFFMDILVTIIDISPVL